MTNTVHPSPFAARHKSLAGYLVKSGSLRGKPCSDHPGATAANSECTPSTGQGGGGKKPAPLPERFGVGGGAEQADRSRQRRAKQQEREREAAAARKKTPHHERKQRKKERAAKQRETEAGPGNAKPKEFGLGTQGVIQLVKAALAVMKGGEAVKETVKKANDGLRDVTVKATMTAAKKIKQVTGDKRDEAEIAHDMAASLSTNLKTAIMKWAGGETTEAEHASHEHGVTQTWAAVALAVAGRLMVEGKKLARKLTGKSEEPADVTEPEGGDKGRPEGESNMRRAIAHAEKQGVAPDTVGTMKRLADVMKKSPSPEAWKRSLQYELGGVNAEPDEEEVERYQLLAHGLGIKEEVTPDNLKQIRQIMEGEIRS